MPNIKKSPRALVAGCAGFIGSYLIESLLAKDILVTGIDNLSTGKEIYLENAKKSPLFKFVKKDLNRGIPSEIINESYDFVFHLASTESYSPGASDEFEYESLITNSIATKNLLDFALKNNAKFLLASSLNIYQGFVSSISLDNYFGSSAGEEKAYSYAEAKRFAEALTWQYYKRHDLDVRIVRLSEVFGPRMNLISSGSLGELLNFYLHDQDLVVSGDGLIKERYAFIDDASRLIEESITSDKKTKGMIFSLVPNLTTPLEISYLLKDMSGGTVDIYFRPSKKVDFIPTVEKIDMSSLDLINFEIKNSFKDGIYQTIEWFGKKTEVDTSLLFHSTKAPNIDNPGVMENKEGEIIKEIKEMEGRQKTHKPAKSAGLFDTNIPKEQDNSSIVTSLKKEKRKININLKPVFIGILVAVVIAGIFGAVIFLWPKINAFSQSFSKDTTFESAKFIDLYKQGKYEELLADSQGLVLDDESESSDKYLLLYLRYISEAKIELSNIYLNAFSREELNNEDLIRVSATVSKFEAGIRSLALYKSVGGSGLDLATEEKTNDYLFALAQNSSDLVGGSKNYLFVLTDSSNSTLYLGEPTSQYIYEVQDYSFKNLSPIEIDIKNNTLDFNEYAMIYVNNVQQKIGKEINGIIFIDQDVIANLSIDNFVLSLIKEPKTSNRQKLIDAITDRKIVFFSTSGDVTLPSDLGIAPVLAFEDSSDFILMNINNIGKTASVRYLVNNIVYTLDEKDNEFDAKLDVNLVHTGTTNNAEEGLFSGDLSFVFPSLASGFQVSHGGNILKENIEYIVSSNKYGTKILTIPTLINPSDTYSVSINYKVSKIDQGYTLSVPLINDIRSQNFTFKLKTNGTRIYNLENLVKIGSYYKITADQENDFYLNI